MVEFREEFLDMWSEQLTVDERKSVWSKFFSLPEVEEVISEVTLDELCSDDFVDGCKSVYILYNIDRDEYEELQEREDKLLSYIHDKATQFDFDYIEGARHIFIVTCTPDHKPSFEAFHEIKSKDDIVTLYRK